MYQHWRTSKKNAAASRTVFDIAAKEREVAEIERAMEVPSFWEDRVRAQETAKDLAELKRSVDGWHRLDDRSKELKEVLQITDGEDPFLEEIERDVATFARETGQMETELFLSGKYDKGNAVLSVYSGAGGKDAEDWAALLYRMYRRFAEHRAWPYKVIDEHWGEERGPAGWGIKNATMAISAPYAYGFLKKEAGVHRLVRISPFSAQQLRHTSFALVDVMPEMVSPEEVEVRPEDLRIDFFRSSGPGGQNVNKRETAVRITHIPSGIQVAAQTERSQDRNRETAMQVLRSRLYQYELQRQERERQGIRQEKVAIEWGNQIRSYVMQPYQMVKDLRTSVQTAQVDEVLDGKIDEFIEAEVRT